ncbi:hypothetical protein BOTBODRAFT_169729 [Botryobasidium botryosum FD-172 SS1]|uniref:Uncharacterized protein n=1 Tax=Botryobasidium botryosum (strain FD-172 SS1) TaxID=930990 RepID=A0A067MZ89_BOTB1|nr:hypothetical protein BOTBODRAFT_169729 [Botryobasidium botryosum FD-172 SS1]
MSHFFTPDNNTWLMTLHIANYIRDSKYANAAKTGATLPTNLPQPTPSSTAPLRNHQLGCRTQFQINPASLTLEMMSL